MGIKRKPAAFGDELTDREKRCAELSALGWSDRLIGRQLGESPRKPVASGAVARDIHNAIIKTGVVGRTALALWALDNVLTREKRAQWVIVAERRRNQLRAARVLNDRRVALLMLLTDPQHCEKGNEELGRLCDPTMSAHAVADAMTAALDNIGPHSSRTKLAVVLKLAPLVVERQDLVTEAESTETL